VVAAVAAGAVAAIVFVALRGSEAPAPPAPTAVELRVEAWRAAGLLGPAGPPDPAAAEARVRAGWDALSADHPVRAREALLAFREAIALAPDAAEAAVAGYATAFAETAGDDPDGKELRAAHDMVREAIARGPGRADLGAAYARLLLVVPSAANDAEALAAASKAAAAAPSDPAVRLALGLAQLRGDPALAVRTLEEGVAAGGDRRLLGAAARARWAAGDAAGALAHADARLALDPADPGALALRAEIEAACGRDEDARATLRRLDAADPASPLPPLLLARFAYQRDGDVAQARRLLDEAMARRPGDFAAARVLAHRAAVELASGNVDAAEAAALEAIRRVPGSAPGRFQAALLAFRRGDAQALRESAGVLGDRAGAAVALLFAARHAELSGTEDEAQRAYLAAAAAAPRDPALLLSAAGALGRLRAPGPALELARQALARDPAEGVLRRAPTDFWEGRDALAEAGRRLETIARDEPAAAATAFAAAATAELLLGRTVAAERLAKAAVAASPQASTPAALLAQVALDRGRPAAALQLATSAVETRPTDAVSLEVRARALEGLGRSLDAERAHREAMEAGPDLVTPRLALGRLLVRRRQAAEGRPLLESLLRDDPDLAEARGALLGKGGGGRR
jgi:Flp pilus assembly protein TadD